MGGLGGRFSWCFRSGVIRSKFTTLYSQDYISSNIFTGNYQKCFITRQGPAIIVSNEIGNFNRLISFYRIWLKVSIERFGKENEPGWRTSYCNSTTDWEQVFYPFGQKIFGIKNKWRGVFWNCLNSLQFRIVRKIPGPSSTIGKVYLWSCGLWRWYY